MKSRPRGGLGRGLGALIPTGGADLTSRRAATSQPPPPLEHPTLAPVPGIRLVEVPVAGIMPNTRQPRQA